MIVVGIAPLRDEPQAGLEVGRPHTGVELPAELGLRHNRLVLAGLVHKRQLLILGRDKVRLDGMQRVRGRGLVADSVLGAGGGRIEQGVLPDGVGAAGVQALDHGELLGDPVRAGAAEALDVGDVSAEGAVDGGAVGAEEDAVVDGGPAGALGAAVGAEAERVVAVGVGVGTAQRGRRLVGRRAAVEHLAAVARQTLRGFGLVEAVSALDGDARRLQIGLLKALGHLGWDAKIFIEAERTEAE